VIKKKQVKNDDYTIDVGSGRITIRVAEGCFGEVDLDSGSGGITVIVPEGMAVRVRGETGSGGVNLPSSFNRIAGDEGVVGEPEKVLIDELPCMVYGPGTGYYHRASDIHFTEFEDCTMTLVRREFLPDCDHADVYWPDGEEWGTAEPRPAEWWEVQEVVSRMLKVHFGG